MQFHRFACNKSRWHVFSATMFGIGPQALSFSSVDWFELSKMKCTGTAIFDVLVLSLFRVKVRFIPTDQRIVEK